MSSNLSIKKRCEFCKNDFIAKTTKTRYCSLDCNRKHYKILAKQKKVGIAENAIKYNIASVDEINKKEFLSAKEAAIILNMSLRTLYRLIENKELNAYNFGVRKTLIRRKDIDYYFDLSINNFDTNNDHLKKLITLENSYSINEASSKYNISTSALYTLINRLEIPKRQFGKFVLVKKIDIDSIFVSHE